MDERKTPSQLLAELAELQRQLDDVNRAHETLRREHDALKQGPRHVEEIIDTMSDLLLVLNPDTSILRTNRATLDLLGYAESDLAGSPLLKILGERSLQAKTWTELLSGTEVRDLELVLRTRSGQNVPITFNGGVIRNAEGKVLGTVCVGRDLRDIRKLLVELQETATAYKQKAEELNASRAKQQELQRDLSQAEKMAALGELAGGMAHEINGPLMVISGNADILADSAGLTSQHKDRVKSIMKASRRCTEIVGKLHGFARTDFSKVENCCLNDHIEDVLSLFESQLTVHNIEPVKELQVGLPSIIGNRGELHQIFTNLVLNARDAMPGGGRLTVRTRREGGWIEAEVSDSGIGIAPEHLDRIFDPFFTTKEIGRGTGLGLSLTRSMMRRARGEINVTSSPGRGTTFTLRFPPAESKVVTSGERPVTRPAQRSLKVLTVDDEESIRCLCRDFLTVDGHTVEEASRAEEALERIKTETYDLVITDLKMPGMGGISMLKQLHETNPRLPVLVMTGSIFNVHKEVGDYPNVVAILRKPFGKQELREAIESLTQTQSRVLLVDDDPIFLKALTKQLQQYKLPIQILTALNGLEAGQQMEAVLPEVVVLDLMMSGYGIDGVEICWALKSVPRTRNICVIVVTGVTDPAILEAAREAGCDHLFQKPVNPDDIVKILRPIVAVH